MATYSRREVLNEVSYEILRIIFELKALLIKSTAEIFGMYSWTPPLTEAKHIHFKDTETFQYTSYFVSPPGVKEIFMKEEALGLLETNFLNRYLHEEKLKNFKSFQSQKGYPKNHQMTHATQK